MAETLGRSKVFVHHAHKLHRQNALLCPQCPDPISTMSAIISKRILDSANPVEPYAASIPVGGSLSGVVTLERGETRVFTGSRPSGSVENTQINLSPDSRLVLEDVYCVLQIHAQGPQDAIGTICANNCTNLVLVHGIQGEMTVRVEIGAQACVELDSTMFQSEKAAQLQILFCSAGTGCLSGTWHGTTCAQSNVRVSGANPGDRVILCYVDDVGVSHALTTLETRRPHKLNSPLSPPPAASRHLPLQFARDAEQSPGLYWIDSDCPLSRPTGILARDAYAAPDVSSTCTQSLFSGRIPLTERAEFAPVHFSADALAPGEPSEAVALAPWQLVHYGGSSLFAHQLVNGQTITQEPNWRWLRYDIPAGLAVNNYQFAGLQLKPASARLPQGYRPQVEIARQRMLNRTSQMFGLELVRDPALRLDFDGLVVDHTWVAEDGLRWRFVLPPGLRPGECRFISRSAVMKETAALDLDDRRTVGVALRSIVVLGHGERRPLDLNHPGWSGLHATTILRGTPLRWTNGIASLPYPAHGLKGGEVVEIVLAATAQYWRPHGNTLLGSSI